jgi:hypothetical protein
MVQSSSTSDDIATARKHPAHRVYDGRLGVYAALGGYARTIPLPWVPGAVLQRVRGALLSDLAAGHGVSLTEEARAELADPRGTKRSHALATQALRIAGDRVAARTLSALGPIRLFLPLRGALQTYVLGRLFERYLEHRPVERGLVIDVDEASRLRLAIDGALVRAVTIAGLAAGWDLDDIDPTAAWVDRALQRVARVPARLTRRLDAGFDDLIEHDGR